MLHAVRDDIAKRGMTSVALTNGGPAATPLQHPEPVRLKPPPHLRQCHYLRPRPREFEGERQSIHRGDDCQNVDQIRGAEGEVGSRIPSAIDEESDARPFVDQGGENGGYLRCQGRKHTVRILHIRQCEWANVKDTFSIDTEPAPRGNDTRQTRNGRKQRLQPLTRIREKVFGVVEQQNRANPINERGGDHGNGSDSVRSHPDGSGEHLRKFRRVRQWGEIEGEE